MEQVLLVIAHAQRLAIVPSPGVRHVCPEERICTVRRLPFLGGGNSVFRRCDPVCVSVDVAHASNVKMMGVDPLRALHASDMYCQGREQNFSLA